MTYILIASAALAGILLFLLAAKLLWSRFRRRKSGGCVVKDCVLTWGDLALRLKG